MNRLQSTLFLALAALSLLLGSGCSVLVNAHQQKAPMMGDYLAGNLPLTQAFLDEKLKEPHWYNSSVIGTGDEIMWRLEAGSLAFLAGDDSLSIAHFDRAQELIADFDARALVNLREIGSESAAIFTNPAALPYRGLCRDRVLLPLFKALAYLGQGDEEGFRVELFRLRENQDKVMADYREFFQQENQSLAEAAQQNNQAAAGINVDRILSDSRNQALAAQVRETAKIAHRGYADFLNPLAIFLSGFGYARDGDYQNAVVDFERLYRALPGNSLIQSYYATSLRLAQHTVPEELKAVKSLDFALGRETVLVIFANGRGPAFQQNALAIPVVFPGYATLVSVAWPVCEYYTRPFKRLQIIADSAAFETVPIADMDGILAREYSERLPGMLTRIALSTAVKELGSYAITRTAARQSDLAQILAMVSLTLYKTAVNNADTRCWEMLPGEFQVVQLPMPKNRQLVLKLDGGSPISATLPPDARSAIVYVNAPNRAACTVRVLGLKSK